MGRGWLWGVLLVGCTSGYEPALSALDRIAVGATSTGSINYQRCEGYDNGDHCYSGRTCEDVRLPIESARFADPSIFAVTHDADTLRFTALAPGTTTLTVVADDDDRTTLTRSITAANPDRVEAAVACSRFGVSGATSFGTNTEVIANLEVFLDSRPLYYDLDYHPLESTFLLLQSDEAYQSEAFLTPATAGTGSITSRFDPTLDTKVTVFAATSATAFSIPGYTIRVGVEILVPGTSLMVNGQPTCIDTYVRTLRVLTPDTCSAPVGTVVGNASFNLVGVAEGDCIVELALDGTSLVAQHTYPVLTP